MKRILNGEKALGVSGGAGISGEKLPNLFIDLNGIGWRAKKSLERRRGTPRPYVAGST